MSCFLCNRVQNKNRASHTGDMEKATSNSENLTSSKIQEGDTCAPHKPPRDDHGHRRSGSGRIRHCWPCRGGSWCPRRTLFGPRTLAWPVIFRNTLSKHEGRIFRGCEWQKETDYSVPTGFFTGIVQHFPFGLYFLSALEGKPSSSTFREMEPLSVYKAGLWAAAENSLESRKTWESYGQSSACLQKQLALLQCWRNWGLGHMTRWFFC